MVNVIIYSIHGSYGIGMVIGLGTNWNNHEQPPLEHNFNKKQKRIPIYGRYSFSGTTAPIKSYQIHPNPSENPSKNPIQIVKASYFLFRPST
jgi:hypothetical protein